MVKKKWKINQTEEFTKSLNEIPEEDKEEVFNELGTIFKGFKDGTIDPEKVGKPVDMEKLKEEEPEVFNKIIESLEGLKRKEESSQ